MKLTNLFTIFMVCTVITTKIQAQIDKNLIDTYSKKFNVVSVDQEDRPEENAIVVNLITKDSYIDQILHTAIDPITNKKIIYYLTSFNHEKIQNPQYAQRAKDLKEETELSNKLYKLNTLTQRNQTIKAQRQEENKILEKFKRSYSARKIQNAFKNYLDLEQDSRMQTFKEKIELFADISYPQFKKLICTGDYITQTDWIYQFVEIMTKRKVFKRNKDKTINSDQFTQEFEKEISNPNDWIAQKIIQYVSEFHQAVEDVFIEKATQKIVQKKLSWTEAVSIQLLNDSDFEQFKDNRLYPKTTTNHASLSTIIYSKRTDDIVVIESGYFNNQSPANQADKVSILAQIFENIIIADPARIKELNTGLTIVQEKQDLIDKTIDKLTHIILNNSQRPVTMFKIQAFGEQIIINIASFWQDNLEIILEQYIDMCLPYMFKMYLNQLGLARENKALLQEHVTSEDTTILHPLFPTIKTLIYFPDPEEPRWPEYVQYDKLFTPEKNIFMQSNINWTMSAEQTFLLGQLILDNDILAFHKLGGQEWLLQQPEDIQIMINNRLPAKLDDQEWLLQQPDDIQSIKNNLLLARQHAMKKNLKSQPRNLLRDLNAMDIEL